MKNKSLGKEAEVYKKWIFLPRVTKQLKITGQAVALTLLTPRPCDINKAEAYKGRWIYRAFPGIHASFLAPSE